MRGGREEVLPLFFELCSFDIVHCCILYGKDSLPPREGLLACSQDANSNYCRVCYYAGCAARDGDELASASDPPLKFHVSSAMQKCVPCSHMTSVKSTDFMDITLFFGGLSTRQLQTLEFKHEGRK